MGQERAGAAGLLLAHIISSKRCRMAAFRGQLAALNHIAMVVGDRLHRI